MWFTKFELPEEKKKQLTSEFFCNSHLTIQSVIEKEIFETVSFLISVAAAEWSYPLICRDEWWCERDVWFWAVGSLKFYWNDISSISWRWREKNDTHSYLSSDFQNRIETHVCMSLWVTSDIAYNIFARFFEVCIKTLEVRLDPSKI